MLRVLVAVLWRSMKNVSKYVRKIDWLQDECPIKATVDVIGGRWKPLILYYLLDRPKRFSELRREIPGVTPQMLTLQLRQLEADEILARKIYAEVPARVEYRLTGYGRTLSTLLRNMRKWGEQHLERRSSGVSLNAHPKEDQRKRRAALNVRSRNGDPVQTMI
jgi:DNA-binding HxlR family transcriptional regulator